MRGSCGSLTSIGLLDLESQTPKVSFYFIFLRQSNHKAVQVNRPKYLVNLYNKATTDFMFSVAFLSNSAVRLYSRPKFSFNSPLSHGIGIKKEKTLTTLKSNHHQHYQVHYQTMSLSTTSMCLLNISRDVDSTTFLDTLF